MKPDEIKEFLKKSLIKNPHRSIFIYGAVGIGKSSVVKQVAAELKFEFRDVRLSLLDATDLRGLPAWTEP